MIKNRLKLLREEMKKEGIDAYYIPTYDYHLSEMVGSYFKKREYMSGFTGSNGDLLVFANEALLWTDGRYFLQAEDELKDTSIKLMKIGEEGVLSVFDYIVANLKGGNTLGFDGKVIPASLGIRFNEALLRREVKINASFDLVSRIWSDQPAMSHEKAFELGLEYAGKSRLEKLNDLQNMLKMRQLDYTLITSLDDIMWLYNLRGNDVACTPVCLSYTLVSQDKAILYVASDALDANIKARLEADKVELRPYMTIYEDIKDLKGKIYFDLNNLNYALYASFAKDTILYNGMNFTTLPKAKKNLVEIENIKKAHIKDGVAVTKFIYWLKHNIGLIPMTEISVAAKLEEFRRCDQHFIEPSFDTIAGYAHHGAIVHYSATKETNIELKKENLLLVDSGGQYLEGTTDITRTIVLGPISDKCKKDFTNVLRGYLNLANAKFKQGARGAALDVLARNPLWQNYQDFNHGTGHGVGYLLNCHEGPQSIHYGRITAHPIEEGMLTSDEPGLYIADEYGIRHESLLLTKKAVSNEYGNFLEFEVVTLVPFDLEGIDGSLMTGCEKNLLNTYHERVYETISPYLTADEAEWLKEVTKEI